MVYLLLLTISFSHTCALGFLWGLVARRLLWRMGWRGVGVCVKSGGRVGGGVHEGLFREDGGWGIGGLGFFF